MNVLCAEHTVKDLSSNRLTILTTLKHKLDCFAYARNDDLCAEHTEKHLFSYLPIHLFTFKKCAFTLAEVLITLGIIGVVAALTISNVIQDYQKKQTVVQLRKVYNDINNAVKLSEIDNGPMSQWDYVQTPSCSNYECLSPFLEKYYLPYFNGAQLLKKSELPNYSRSMASFLSLPYIRLNNGVLLQFFGNIPVGYIWLIADINGEKEPNKVGRDIFVFDAYKNGTSVYKIKFWGHNYTNKDALTSPSGQYSCRKDNNHHYANFHCGRLIELNNWEIPKDYPW